MYISQSQQTNEWYPVYFEIKKRKSGNSWPLSWSKMKKKGLDWKEVWTVSTTHYMKSAVENVEEKLKKKGERLPSKTLTPTSQR